MYKDGPKAKAILLVVQWQCLSLHDNAVLTLLGLPSFLALLNFGNHTLEGLADVLVESGACFGPSTAELLGELATIFSLDLTLFGSKIGLVADDDQWH